MKTKKPIPHDSYPPEDYIHDAAREPYGHCDCCGLPVGRVYPRKHKRQTQEFERIQCGATWFELPSED